MIADFRAKTKELFHEISEMNPSEIEETVKYHVQAKIDEYGIDATIVDAVVTGSRCRGLERENSDLDVVVELFTNDREDDLFHALNEDGLHIGEIKVDINPITAQRTGTLETYLPQAEKYLESIREERQQEQLLQVKVQKEVNKKEQGQSAVRTSLKVRLAEKKAQVAGHGEEGKENVKKNQREV